VTSSLLLLYCFLVSLQGASDAFAEAAARLRKAVGYEHVRCAEVIDTAAAKKLGLAETPALKIVRRAQGAIAELL